MHLVAPPSTSAKITSRLFHQRKRGAVAATSGEETAPLPPSLISSPSPPQQQPLSGPHCFTRTRSNDAGWNAASQGGDDKCCTSPPSHARLRCIGLSLHPPQPFTAVPNTDITTFTNTETSGYDPAGDAIHPTAARSGSAIACAWAGACTCASAWEGTIFAIITSSTAYSGAISYCPF